MVKPLGFAIVTKTAVGMNPCSYRYGVTGLHAAKRVLRDVLVSLDVRFTPCIYLTWILDLDVPCEPHEGDTMTLTCSSCVSSVSEFFCEANDSIT